jgi:putative transposase
VQKAFILKQRADGIPVAEICRRAGISQAPYLNWKKKYDGLSPTDMKQLNSPKADGVDGSRFR